MEDLNRRSFLRKAALITASIPASMPAEDARLAYFNDNRGVFIGGGRDENRTKTPTGANRWWSNWPVSLGYVCNKVFIPNRSPTFQKR